jgi:hypothetical protein
VTDLGEGSAIGPLKDHHGPRSSGTSGTYWDDSRFDQEAVVDVQQSDSALGLAAAVGGRTWIEDADALGSLV